MHRNIEGAFDENLYSDLVNRTLGGCGPFRFEIKNAISLNMDETTKITSHTGNPFRGIAECGCNIPVWKPN
jgi:hypothetical protein